MEFTMMTKRQFMLTGASLAAVAAVATRFGFGNSESRAAAATFPVTKTDEEWRKILTGEQYSVLRKQDTEAPGSSPLLQEHRKGTFHCAGCDNAVYSSETKFESGTGWPSFWAAIDGGVGTEEDNTLFMTRTEVHCSRCGGHLGHIFDDGPKPTGMRHCINGVALTFAPATA
jgi:peptide-methionine (R)-S-oxide reductase